MRIDPIFQFLSVSGPTKRAQFKLCRVVRRNLLVLYCVLLEHRELIYSNRKRRLGGPIVKEVKEVLLRTR